MGNIIKFIIAFLFFTRIFQLVGLNIPNSILTAVLGYFVISELSQKSEFSFLIRSFVCFIFFSCISSYVYRGQYNIFTTFTQSFIYLSLAFYFVCSWLKMNSEEVERSLVIIGLISVGAYFLQNAVYPTVIFADAQNDYVTEVRIRMCGSIIYSFLFFYGINKYVIKRRAICLLYAALAFVCVMIMGFRSLTVSLLALGILEYGYLSGFSMKRLKQFIPLLVIIAIVSQLDIVGDKFSEMMARQERGDNFDNADYVRFAEFDYYWNNYFTNNIERFFGSGLPVNGTALHRLQTYNFSFNLFWNDWGLLGLSWIYGIPAICILYFMYLKVIFSKLPKDYLYLKVLCVFLVLTSLTSAEAFRPGNLLLQGAFFYLVMHVKKKR